MRKFDIPKGVGSIDHSCDDTLIAVATNTIASLSNRPLDGRSAAGSPGELIGP